jgi:hypothetical protein
MNRCYHFKAIGSSGAPSTSLSHWYPLTQLIWRIHWRTVGSSGAEGLLTNTLLLASSWPSDRPMLLPTKASVHLVLLDLSWRVSVLIQIECRIDRRCPHLDCQIIRCYCLLQFFSFQLSDAIRVCTIGSSDGVNLVWPSAQCTKCTDASF